MMTRIFVWHDKQGKIIAVGKPARQMVNRMEPVAVKETHSVFSTEVEEHEIKNMLRTHRVDIASSQLKRKE
jgi:co-chaperonin GroES (HSP10)